MEESWQVQAAVERGEHLRRATALGLLAADDLATVSVRDGLVHVEDECLDPVVHQARQLSPRQVLALLCTPAGTGEAAGGLELFLCSCYWRCGWWHTSGTSVSDEAVALLEVVRATYWLGESDGGAVFDVAQPDTSSQEPVDSFGEMGDELRWCSRAVAQLYTLQHTRTVLVELRRGARRSVTVSSPRQLRALQSLIVDVDDLLTQVWQLLSRYRDVEPGRRAHGEEIVELVAAVSRVSLADDHTDVGALEVQRRLPLAWLPGTVGAALLTQVTSGGVGPANDVLGQWAGMEPGVAVWVEVPVTTGTAEAFAGAVRAAVQDPGVVWAQRRSRAFLRCEAAWLMSLSDKIEIVAPPPGVSLREFTQLGLDDVQAAARMAVESPVSVADMMRALFASRL